MSGGTLYTSAECPGGHSARGAGGGGGGGGGGDNPPSHTGIELNVKSSFYPESYDMSSNLEIKQVFINASICTYSHAGNDKGMLQQQRELQLMETVYLTYCNRI